MSNVEDVTRLDDHWWCEEHRDIHVGSIESWTMAHRMMLHPVYVAFNSDRLRAMYLARITAGELDG